MKALLKNSDNEYKSHKTLANKNAALKKKQLAQVNIKKLKKLAEAVSNQILAADKMLK